MTRNIVLFVGTVLLAGCAAAGSAPENEPQPHIAQTAGGKVAEKGQRQQERVTEKIEGRVDEKTDQAVDSVLDRVLDRIFN